MKYVEISVHTTTEGQELVGDIFLDNTVEGVSIFDKNDLINLNKKCHHWDYIEDDIMDKYGEETIVKGYIEEEKYKEVSQIIYNKLNELKERSLNNINVGSLECTNRVIEGDDWVNTFREHFKPIKINNIVICPEWIEYTPKDNEQVVLLDVGMAFGTGEHETTSLIVEMMQDFNLEGKYLFDIGTGSGILGITAAKLGAKKVYMSDIDQMAVESATNNAKLNGVLNKVTITKANLLDENADIADIVVSNITAEVLIMMCDDMAKILESGKPLLLSGILKDRMHLIEEHYGKYFDIKKVLTKNDWCGVYLERK